MAIGVRMSRCSCAIAAAFSNGIGSSNQPGPERPQRVVEQHRGARRQELAALDEDLAVAAQALARALDERGGAPDLARLVVAQALVGEGAALERVEAAPHGLLRARRTRLPASARPAASGSRSRAGGCGRRRRAGARRARPGACLRGPTTRCRARTAPSRTRRRRASATRGRGGASAARVPPDPRRRDAARTRGWRLPPPRWRRAATPRPSPTRPSSVLTRTKSQLHQSTQYLNVSMRVIFTGFLRRRNERSVKY